MQASWLLAYPERDGYMALGTGLNVVGSATVQRAQEVGVGTGEQVPQTLSASGLLCIVALQEPHTHPTALLPNCSSRSTNSGSACLEVLKSTGPDGLMQAGGVMETTVKVRYKLGCLCAAPPRQGRQRRATDREQVRSDCGRSGPGGDWWHPSCDLIGFLLGDK